MRCRNKLSRINSLLINTTKENKQFSSSLDTDHAYNPAAHDSSDCETICMQKISVTGIIINKLRHSIIADFSGENRSINYRLDDDLLINILNFHSPEMNVSRDWFDWRATREKSISGNFYKKLFPRGISIHFIVKCRTARAAEKKGPSISRRVKAHFYASFGCWRFDFEAAVSDFCTRTTQLVKLFNSSPARERPSDGFAEEKTHFRTHQK